jgi:hypothetical protein
MGLFNYIYIDRLFDRKYIIIYDSLINHTHVLKSLKQCTTKLHRYRLEEIQYLQLIIDIRGVRVDWKAGGRERGGQAL